MRALTIAAAVAGLAVLAPEARAAGEEHRPAGPAVLESQFGTAGIAPIPFSGEPAAIAAVPGEAVVVAGGAPSGAWLVRLTRDGSLDRAFGSEGRVPFSAGVGTAIRAIAALADGRVVVAGRVLAEEGPVPFVARLLPDGRPDESFGTRGVTRFDGRPRALFFIGGRGPAANAVAAVPGGLLVLLPGLDVARLREDGSLDPAFADDGIAEPPREQVSYEPVAVLPGRDGGVIAIGRFKRESGLTVAGTVVVRFRVDGGFDRGYGELPLPGRLLGEVPEFQATAVASRDGVAATVAGLGECGFTRDIARDLPCGGMLRRLDARGRLSAGGFPLPATSIEPHVAQYRAIVEQRGGGTLAFGALPGRAALVRRFDEDGRPDHGFGACGTRTRPPGVRPDAAAEQPDGSVVIAGLQPDGTPAAVRWTSRAARGGVYGERLATALVRARSLDAVLRGGSAVRLFFSDTARVRLRLRATSLHGRRVVARRVLMRRSLRLDACERTVVPLRVGRRDDRRLRRRPRGNSLRLTLEVSAAGRRGTLLRRSIPVT